ncbi:mid region of cactin-domain-containing protein [Phialemonium atrogriseum]|uniref:Splicing factor Cactin n=1 Tax=Phialemonium atrogriseum TaxID=1093897 RepID=A0AAJ0FH83_9PEZI|nr:mid region of cactin-domain-containing protein [Phialemonium atrogriseum]KAK1763138.1 mid region of cactin-domain-containing protein [Phialemonium atrogriseum]
MIEGWKPPSQNPSGQRDITSPRRDPQTRITKRPRPNSSRPTGVTNNPGKYVSQDEQSRQFVADEDKFVLKQSKKKADIRVREGRAKSIDYLAFNLRFIDSDRDVFDDDDVDAELPVPAPEAVLEGLNEAQLKELDEDMASYLALETGSANREYWKALLAICADRRQKLAPRGPEGRAVNSVASDIDKILSPKTYEQLEALEKQIKTKLESNEPIDTDYWEELLRSLRVWKAKAKLQKVYKSINAARIELLKERNPELAEKLQAMGTLPQAVVATAKAAPKAPVGTATSLAPGKAMAASSADASRPPPGTARFAETSTEDFSQATKALYDREVARGISENEEIFMDEAVVPAGIKPLWAEKYRPRKPRYFNRVQMGYEWNKYNQTHYDHDNPPPKVVQGYKFNMFYPDLIDKTKAPTYKIIREHGRRRGESFAPAGEEDTCLIRFIAGPPYEDVAFRIVDREWDYSAKKERGFKSSFDKGILQLHFQFKKIYYRK